MNDKVEKLQYQHFNFGPFVFYIRLPDRIKERMLADAQDIYDLPSHEYQLAGEIEKQRRYKEETVKWFVEETSRIFQIYRAEHCKFHEIPDIIFQYEINDIWVNFMEAGEVNPTHVHGGDLSFVYFLKVPWQIRDEGILHEGRNSAPGRLTFDYTHDSHIPWGTCTKSIEPKEGHMVIFPSMLRHYVSPFKSKVQRISISGNLLVKNRDEFPYKHYF